MTHAASLYIQGVPVDSTNVTATNTPYALWVDAGETRLDGAVTSTGVITGSTLEATGDTASGDNAAIGYTSAEGLILTGQGSTSDITVKNDADGTVFTVPTGTDDILFPDSAKAMWGASSDMQLYHDGSNSYITNAVGALKIATETSGIAVTIGHGTSEVTIADNLTVTGTLTLGSGAELTEAELEFLDGITAGTAAASKAMVLDSSADITGGRNITISGELDAATLDVSGNADIDGTTNLDAVDIDGAVQIDATVTVGVDDTGYDVKFFGATSGAYMLWDESADCLQIYKTSNEALLLDSGADNNIYITLTDDGSNSGAKIGYDVTNDSLALGHHDVGDVFRINASGAVSVGVNDTGYDVKFFGAAAGAFALWDESANLLEIRGATAAGPGHLKLTTGETTVVDGDILGRIDFQAPAETGTDAISVAASIWAEADSTFSSTVNATELVFATALSETAFERMRLDQDGRLGIGTSGPNNIIEARKDQDSSTAINVTNDTSGTAAAATFGAASDTADLNIRVTSGSWSSSGASTPDTCIIMAEASASGGLHLATADTAPVSIYVDGSERVNVDSNGTVFINETVNANMTTGLTINQGGADNQIIALKSTDVDHGMTGVLETDSYGGFGKNGTTRGGLQITGISSTDATTGNESIVLRAYTEDTALATAKSTSAGAALVMSSAISDGSTGRTTPGANENLVCIKGESTTQFIFDADGDSHQNVGTAWTNFDDKDDALLSRSLGIVMDTGSAIQTKWDDWGRDHKEDLIQAKIIPRLTNEEIENGDRALVNTSQVMRLHNGAIWQLHCHQQNLEEVVDYQQEEIESLKKELRLLKG